MNKIVFFITFLNLFAETVLAQPVLIVVDEIPAMETLAKALKERENIDTKIIVQSELPTSISDFRAVIVYIHKDLDAGPEKAFIEYTRNGGRLICLHHSISSVKRKNKSWFTFLDLDLPTGDVEAGGYKYLGDIDMAVVNLAQKHFITTNKINYDSTFSFVPEGSKKKQQIPGFVLYQTEAFLNHNLHYNTSRTMLMGLKMRAKNGMIWMQSRSCWYMHSGKGLIFYSQPGHVVSDFENPIYAQIVANMVIFKISSHN